MRDFEYGLGAPGTHLTCCLDCNLIRQDPMPSREELATFYQDEYANIRNEEHPLMRILVELYYRRLASFFRNMVGEKGEILDVGCSTGHLIGQLARFEPNWTLRGVEPHPKAVEIARSKGREVLEGTLQSIDLPPESQDLIILSHVIEHLTDPVEVLQRIRELLRPGGQLYVETPNTACVDLRLFGRYWGGHHYPRHTYLFSRDNLARLLTREGFKVVQTLSTLHIFGWALSVQNLLVDRIGLQVHNGRAPFYAPLALLSLPLVLLQKGLGQAAGMGIVAQKDKTK